MINVYQKTNLDFTKNGDATLQPIRCDLSMEINGAWSLEIEVPYDEEGKWEYLVEGSVIIVDVDCIRELSNTKQRFRVYDYKKGISSLTAIAFPVAMESTHDAPIENVVITNKTGAQAMTQLQAFTNKYTLYSNIANTGSTALSNTNVNSAIASGKDDCFIQIWGGEICYDNLKFSVLNRLGENQAEKHPVIYGRNMTDVSYEKDDSGLITRLYPISQDGIRLSYDGKSYVDSPKIQDYPIVHSRFIQAPYKLVIDDIANGSQTAVLTRSIQSQISTLVNTLSHSVYNSAVANKVEPEYIKKIRSDIVEAVQDMATANIYHADMNKIMRASIKSSMDWLKDVSKPTWTWHGDGSPSNPYWYGASESSRATSEWVYVDRIWRYFGDNSYWQRPKDDSSKKWDWIQKSNGYFYGNNERYYAQKTYVYITMNGQMKEYWFDEDGYWDGSDDTDSDYTWHQSGDAWWFGEDGATAEDTSKFLHDGWWFIDGVYYYFDENGYWIDSQDTTKRDFQWDWVETSNSKWWFGNDADHEFMHIWVQNQWLKIGGDWYRFGSDNYAVGGTALETEIINLFKTGMAQLKTTCETLNTQAYTLLYNLMKGYCDRSFEYQGIDVPTVTITVNMVDLSQTIEYKDYKNLEKVCLGDNVKCVDYEHGISTTERVVSITYDCIRRYNSTVTIGVAESTVADKLGVNAGGGEASGGFDTSVIESTLTSHTNELARLDSAKQDKLTAGENITIVNNVISATGGGGGNGHNAYYGLTPPNASLGEDESIYYQLVGQCSELVLEEEYQWNELYNDGSKIIVKGTSAGVTEAVVYRLDDLIVGSDITVSFKGQLTREGGGNTEFYQYVPIETNRYVFGFEITDDISRITYVTNVPDLSGDYSWFEEDNLRHNYTMTTEATATTMYMVLYFQDIIDGETNTFTITDFTWSGGQITRYTISDLWQKKGSTWISSEFNEINIFEGATATSDGKEGLVPKPEEGDDAKYLKGDGTWSELDVTEVIANPSGQAVANLSKLQVGDTIYDIPSGGGGGGSGYERSVLYNTIITSPQQVILSDNIDNYDVIEVIVAGGTSVTAFHIDVSYFKDNCPYISNPTYENDHWIIHTYQNRYARLIMGDANNKLYPYDVNNQTINEIAGLKYGGGGGGGTLEMCDYAEFNRTRITLPFTISADYTVEVDFDADVYFDNQYVIGNTSGASLLHLTQYGGRWYCSGGSGEVNFAKATTGRHTFKCNYNNKNWFDGEEVTNYTPTTDGATLLIGGRGSEGDYQGKIYSYKITSISTGDTLLDLKPAKLTLAGVIVKEGLYDSVTQRFFENSLVTVGND